VNPVTSIGLSFWPVGRVSRSLRAAPAALRAGVGTLGRSGRFRCPTARL